MDDDVRIKLAIYSHFAETGRRPSPAEVAARVGSDAARIVEAYRRLRAQRVLVLEEDDASIRMAPPFSGVPTQHVVESAGITYFANCAWDSFGIPAALHRPSIVLSRCEQSLEPLRLEVGVNGPSPRGVSAGAGGTPIPGTDDAAADVDARGGDWLFHCLVPAAKWWDDIVFT